MLSQEYGYSASEHHPRASKTDMSVLAYRSVAVAAPTDAEVQQLLRSAQSRNKAEGLTGVLVYERGSYFQWLEGPTDALMRVWHSISRDPRHRQIRLLRYEALRDRVFAGWDLRVALGAQVSVEAAIAAMDSSNALLKRVVGKSKSIVDLSWDDVFSTIVIPRLKEVHGRDAHAITRYPPTAAIWHAERESGEILARALIAPRSGDSRRYVNLLLDQGANLNALYREVFEPAQVQLGKLWDDYECDDFHLTVGLSRLQLELRRINAEFPATNPTRSCNNVLLCSQPNEPHSVGLMMSSEMFDRRGWGVNCEFPSSDQILNDLVHANWFDVLKLSQSGSLRRDSRLDSMRTTIDSARSASLNPSLIVMVDGRTFIERPKIYLEVHAHAMSSSVLDAVCVAERLLAASRSLTSTCQVSVA